MNNYPDFMVSIRCMTYNHAPYIEDAMNGFCMQQTTFPFVAIIVDDASTDGEPEVIRHYLEKYFEMQSAEQWETDDANFVYARHKENMNCYFAVILLKYNFWQAKKAKSPLMKQWTQTKYVALCEGDDYWTDKEKLSKQISILENNSNIDLIYTDFDRYEQNNGRMTRGLIGNGRYPKIMNFEQHLLLRGYIAPMSWVYRSEYSNISSFDKKRPRTIEGSFVFALEMFLQHNVYYLDNVTCVHRILEESASHSKNPEKVYKYNRDVMSLQKYYANNYYVSDTTKEQLTDWFYKRFFIYILKAHKKEDINGLNNYYSKIQKRKLKRLLFSVLSHHCFGRFLLYKIYESKM